MGLFETVGAGVKAVAASLSPAGSTPFSNWGTGLAGSSSASGYLGAGAVTGQAEFGAALSSGSRDDYTSDVGDVSLNGIVSAAVSAIAEAFCAAPFVLEQFDGQNWNRVDSHPCIELLHNPNPHYGRDQLWEAEIAGEIITGNGYMRAVWNQARTQPVELWHESLIAPIFDLRHFIGSYRIFVDGRPYPLAASALYGKSDDPMKGARVDHALHFRYRLNRRNPRFGESPLLSVTREIAGDNVAATWQTAVLKNGAGASFFVTTKEGANITPAQMEAILSQTERRLRREGAGRVAGSNLPVDFHKVSFSPDELALDRLPGHYESRVCAALKTPPMILGLGAGDDHKTYANYGEAIDDFWQRTIIPLQNRKGAELVAQLFPLFGMDKREWRLGFDRSQIAALQDDEGALYERVTKAVGGPWMQPNEAREKAKLPALEETEPEGESEENGEAKAWDRSKHPRADNGEFGSSQSVPKIGEKVSERQLLSALRARADQGLPEGAYAVDSDGLVLDYAEASEANPDEVELDSTKYKHIKKVDVYHSHPYESPPSHADWAALLTEENIDRVVSVTPGFVYVMQREGSEKGKYPARVAALIMLAHVKSIKEEMGYKGKSDKEIGESNLVKVWDKANLRMAKDYHILLTKEEHK